MGEKEHLARRAPLFILGAICLAFGACGQPKQPDKTISEELQLIEAGIAALWNDGPIAEIHAVEVHSIYRQDERDGGERIASFIQPKTERYLEERLFRGIRVVQALNGEEAWATVDGMPVPVPEKERILLGLHPFLFSVSLLRTLQDESQFDLKFRGTVTLENQVHAQRLEVSPLGNDILSKMVIILDFGTRDHLVRRVELQAEGTNESHILFMDDHRPVPIQGSPSSHMMVAFRLTAFQDKNQLGFETVNDVTFNKPNPVAFFSDDKSTPTKQVLKDCVSGRVALVKIEAGQGDKVDSQVEDLKQWIEDSGLKTAGPLVFVRDLTKKSASAPQITQIFIPIASGDDLQEPHKIFSIETIVPSTALCQTLVGTPNLTETLESLQGAADDEGKTTLNLAYEIHFTPDGSTRQIQLLLKED